MPDMWEKAFTELNEFTQAHPEIKLDTDHMSIPIGVRSEFWHLFENAGEALLGEYFPVVKEGVEKLNWNYVKLKEDIIKQLNLKGSTAPSPREAFMCKPSNALVKGRQGNALINLLIDKADFSELKTSAARTIENVFASQGQQGYENWVCLALLKLLHSSRVLEVKFKKITPTYILNFSPVEIPEPMEMDIFPLQENKNEALVMPVDFIADAAKCFVGFKMNVNSFQDSKRPAVKLSRNREWIPNGGLGRIMPGMTLIYNGSNPHDIALVSDKLRICRPDLILECRWESGWFNQKAISDIKSHHDVLNPRLGTFIISNEVVSEEMFDEVSRSLAHAELPLNDARSPKSNIKLLNVGFSANRLQPLADAIIT